MKPLAFTLGLMLAGCAATSPVTDEPQPSSSGGATSKAIWDEDQQSSRQAGPIEKGAVDGALTGAKVCGLPFAGGSVFGPVGLVVGGIITLYCLPFGIAGGAIIGGLSGVAPVHESAALPENPR